MSSIVSVALAGLLSIQAAEADRLTSADVDAIEQAVTDVHPDPFTRIGETEWRDEGDRLRTLADEAPDREVAVALMRWVARLGDGHTNLEPSGLPEFARWYPVRFTEFADGVFITAAQGPALDYSGARVIAIGGVPAAEAGRQQATLQGADNMFGALEERYLLSNAGVMEALGLADADGGLPLTLELDGARVEAVVEPVTSRWEFDWRFWVEFVGPPVSDSYRDWHAGFNGEAIGDYLVETPEADLPLHLTYRRPYWFTRTEADPSTIYFAFHFVQNWGDESFAEFVDRLFEEIETIDAPRLVIDLRYNSGGDGSMVLPLVHAIIRNGTVNASDRLFVLTGPKTFSAAVNLTSHLEHHTNASFVGTPPGAPLHHFGDARQIELPSGLSLYVSSVRHQGGYLGESGTVFAIDVPAPMTGAAYFAGGDPALEIILSDADSRPIETIFEADGAAAAIGAADLRMRTASGLGWEGYRPFPEYPFSIVAYTAYLNGNIEGGMALLELIARYYPQSSRAQRQLGDVYRAAGRTDDARTAYERALALDSYNGEARSGLDRLDE